MITASMTPYAMQSLESSPSGLYTPITMTTTTQKTVRAARTMKSHTIHGRMNQCLHWKSKGNLIKIMMPSAAPNIRGRAGQPTTPIPCGLIPPCIHPSYGKTRVGAREEGREGGLLGRSEEEEGGFGGMVGGRRGGGGIVQFFAVLSNCTLHFLIVGIFEVYFQIHFRSTSKPA